MCLGVPARVVSIKGNSAVVDVWGLLRDVRLDWLEEPVVPGDFIIDHAGCAERRIAPADVADTVAIYEVLFTESGEYPCASHSRGHEIEIEIEEPSLV